MDMTCNSLQFCFMGSEAKLLFPFRECLVFELCAHKARERVN